MFSQKDLDGLLSRWKIKVQKTSTCWLWTGSILASGYGCIGFKHKTWRAHRAAWLLFRGPIPAGLFVCHVCDIRHCVNPDHLFLGTQYDNIHDAISKGKSQIGDLNSQAKLTLAQVIEIKNDLKAGKSGSKLARQFDVTRFTISNIKAGRKWKHVSTAR